MVLGYRRFFTKKPSHQGVQLQTSSVKDCIDERLVCADCICKQELTGESDPFGNSDFSNDDIMEREMYLQFRDSGARKSFFKFRTQRTNRSNGKVVIRYLILEKKDSKLNYVLKDATKDENLPKTILARLGPRRKLNYYVEVWHMHEKDIIRYPNNSKAPLLRRSLNQMLRDPLELPLDLGGTFYIRILAMGNPNRRRQLQINCRFRIECRGFYPFAKESVDESETLGLGETKVLNNGKY